jgi:hypothetical protein
MIRKLGLRSLAVILAVLVAAVPAFSAGSGDGEVIDPAALKGEIAYMEGDVFLNGVPAVIGTQVSPGDRISTGALSIAEVKFGSRNILQFQENTESLIQSEWSGVEMKQGGIAAVLNGLKELGFGASKQFTVRTDTAVMAVRGTTFFVDQKNANETYLCTCNGQLHMEGTDGRAAMDTEAYNHQGVWYVRTPDGVGSFPSALYFHDTPMLNKLASRAGTRIAWKE